MQNLQKREFRRNMDVDEMELTEYEEYEEKFLKNPEELESFGYEVKKESTPETEYYWIRKWDEYLVIRVYKATSRKGTIEISFDGNNFFKAGMGLDILVDKKNRVVLILYFLKKGKCDEEHILLQR